MTPGTLFPVSTEHELYLLQFRCYQAFQKNHFNRLNSVLTSLKSLMLNKKLFKPVKPFKAVK
jgi:hypothetical protein